DLCSVRLTGVAPVRGSEPSTTSSTLGEHLMHGLRYRILAGTALALILAVPMVGLAQGPNKMAPAPTTASPPAALPVEHTATPAPASPAEQAARPPRAPPRRRSWPRPPPPRHPRLPSSFHPHRLPRLPPL